MTESRFVDQNREQWDKYTLMIDHWDMYSPSELGEAYLCICSDLAFAQTHYPGTHVCTYLNSLSLQFHHILYRRQPQRWKELLRFISYDIPMSFYRSRKFLYLALLLFIIGDIIGVLSQHLNPEYFERFFGYGYYAETMNNIEGGNPMDIYANTPEVTMYLRIAFNNIIVGLRYFLQGLLTPFYVIYYTLMTGIMDGCFIAFFFQQGEGVAALVAPNEHGALELPAIIVCSAAGMQFGMGWFFPGKLTRMKALRQTAADSLILALAMVPVFAFAAFIESFITRHQEWPMALRLAIVTSGLLFVAFYMIYLPYKLSRKDTVNR